MSNFIKKSLSCFLLALVVFLVPSISFAVTRDEIMNTAKSYKSHLWTASEGNVCHNKVVWKKDKRVRIDTPDENCGSACSGLGWWGAEGENIGMPYKWGGFNTLESFDNGIRAGACGGDVYKRSIELSGYGSYDSDAVGIDCSGFVSRSWNLKGQKTTKSLPDISKELGKDFGFDQTEKYQSMKKGDIFNIYGYHVMLCGEDNPFTENYEVKVYESSGNDWKANNRNYTFDKLTHNNVSFDKPDEPYRPYTYLSLQDPGFSFADIEVVIDYSGSMGGTDMGDGIKIERAKEIAKYFVDMAKPNNRVGITSFDESGYSDYPLTLVGNNNAAKTEMKNVVDAISASDNQTFMKEGLEIARGKLNTVEKSASTKAIILITDGFESSDFFYVRSLLSDIIPQIIEDGIKIYPIQIKGESGHNPPQVYLSMVEPKISSKIRLNMGWTPHDYSYLYDSEVKKFLKRVAGQTGGAYYVVEDLKDFQKIYNSIAADLYQEKETKLASGTVPGMGNKLAMEGILVDPSIEEITFSLTWPGSDLDLVLIKPDGTEISSSTVNEYSDISFVSADTYEIYKVSQPMNGEWRLKIIGIDIPQEGEDYTLAISELGGMDFETELDREEYFQGDSIKITAGVVDQTLDIPETQYLYGAEIKVEAEDPDGGVHLLSLSDEGFDGDEEAGDGIYAGLFSETLLIGNYIFTISVQGFSNDEAESPFERTKTLSVFVNKAEKKNVIITVSDKEGSVFDEIILEAEIKDEDGELLAANSNNEVNFKVGDEVIGSAAVDDSGKAKISWMAGLVPKELMEIHPIIVSFGGSEKYFPTQGQGDFTLISARQLKLDTLTEIGIFQNQIAENNKHCRGSINHAAKFIEESLDDKFWLDASRLNSFLNSSSKNIGKSGVRVFNKESQTVKELLKIIKRKNRCSDLIDENEVKFMIDKLVQADALLAKVALDETKNISAKNSKSQKIIDRQIERAEKNIQRAYQELDKNKPDKAINYFKNAWIHCQIVGMNRD